MPYRPSRSIFGLPWWSSRASGESGRHWVSLWRNHSAMPFDHPVSVALRQTLSSGYHPSCKDARGENGGGGGIRTLETLVGPTRFRVVRVQPDSATPPNQKRAGCWVSLRLSMGRSGVAARCHRALRLTLFAQGCCVAWMSVGVRFGTRLRKRGRVGGVSWSHWGREGTDWGCPWVG